MSPLSIPKIAQGPVTSLLAHTVFQLRPVDEQGAIYRPHGSARLSLALNRALVERGRRAPWMWSAERCQQFWAGLDCGDDPNAPNGYAAKPTAIVDLLHDFWRPDVALNDTVLEIGCNAGANLAWLQQLGYSRLSGVEINPHAIAELRRAFPELADTVIVQGRLEDVLPTLETSGVDVVFAMGVLLHIHPSSRWIFSELVRVARRHICVIDAEHLVSHYVFCRDYRRVFEGLGCRQVRAVEIGRPSFPAVEDYHGSIARLFRVPAS